MARWGFTDQFEVKSGSDVTASASLNGVAYSTGFDCLNTGCPSILAHLTAIGGSKKVSLKIQESDDNATWTDAPPLASGADSAQEFTAVGVCYPKSKAGQSSKVAKGGIYYAGDKRYFRLGVISKTASPAATVRVYYIRNKTWDVPSGAND